MLLDTPDNKTNSTPTQDIEAEVLEELEANGHIAENENLNSIVTSITVTSSKTIGLHLVKVYITAVTDLWTQQTLSGANNHPNL
ncbi:hypothetical protein HK098_007943 [Nowakowskiella sp. JEL0407]|nr:hypothetical protein HK098_007943 [Nowakowskiella sp. JEL0407]